MAPNRLLYFNKTVIKGAVCGIINIIPCNMIASNASDMRYRFI